jgi:hypothetical protein
MVHLKIVFPHGEGHARSRWTMFEGLTTPEAHPGV